MQKRSWALHTNRGRSGIGWDTRRSRWPWKGRRGESVAVIAGSRGLTCVCRRGGGRVGVFPCVRACVRLHRLRTSVCLCSQVTPPAYSNPMERGYLLCVWANKRQQNRCPVEQKGHKYKLYLFPGLLSSCFLTADNKGNLRRHLKSNTNTKNDVWGDSRICCVSQTAEGCVQSQSRCAGWNKGFPCDG